MGKIVREAGLTIEEFRNLLGFFNVAFGSASITIRWRRGAVVCCAIDGNPAEAVAP